MGLRSLSNAIDAGLLEWWKQARPLDRFLAVCLAMLVGVFIAITTIMAMISYLIRTGQFVD